MSKVAVVRSWFLPVSETFIYSELVNLKTITPMVCCKKKMNLNHFPFDPIYEFNNGNELKEILNTQQADLIHARYGVTGVELLDVKKKLGIPMLTSFHGFDLPSNKKTSKKYKGKLKRFFKEGEAFTTTSDNMKRILVDYGCPKKKIFVHHSGIDVVKFPFKKREFPKDKVITLLTVGRLVEKKGMQYLIEAFSRVHKKYPQVRLRIAGDGILRNKLEARVKKLKLEKVVKFLGEVSHDDVVEEMKKVHLFVLASTTSKKGDQEGIPNVLKEAMATGLPVVSTKHAGIPELVRNGKSGVLVRERDATAMADELLHLIKNPHKWGKMGKAGRKIVKKSFHTPKQIGELENLYATILKKSR